MSNRARLARLAGAASILMALGACNEGNSPVVMASAPVERAGTPAGYRIAREDTLEIAVFMVPSLNRTVQVDGNGRIDLPLLGKMDAAGRTTREVEADIARDLGAKYVRSPQVTVTVKDGLAQRFAVDGAVLKPGIYVARGETTLLQAIAEAGGPNEVGDVDDVSIIRVVDGQRQTIRFSLRGIRTGQAPDPQVYGKDAVVVGESATLSSLKFVKDIGAPVIGVARLAVP